MFRAKHVLCRSSLPVPPLKFASRQRTGDTVGLILFASLFSGMGDLYWLLFVVYKHIRRAGDTHHVGGVRREGRRPAQPCACVEGRPAPVVNESPTWAPIGWDVCTYAHTCSLGKHGGVGWSSAMVSLLGFVGLA